MSVEIVPYAAASVPGVKAFNSRLRAAGVPFAFRETEVPRLIRTPGSTLFQEYFLAVDEEGVRGGYLLMHQDFMIRGQTVPLGVFQFPLSEGTADRRYSLVAAQLLRHALRREPLLFSLGIGGYEEAALRLLRSARFSVAAVPFYFRVEHAAPVLRELRLLRSSPLRRLISDIGATTGVAAVGLRAQQRLRAGRVGREHHVEASDFATFGPDSDTIWDRANHAIAFGAVRDSSVLARLYDAPGNRFVKVAIADAGEPCGWAVCLATQVRDHKHFGNLRLGSIVDCLALPGYERALVSAAVQRLRRENVDLIVTNQSLASVGQALRRSGFLSGPSNFLFAGSPQLVAGFEPLEASLRTFHLNRGDGDGPINL